MTKIDKNTYIEFLKKVEEADIPENAKFIFRNSWYGGYIPTNTTLPIEYELK